MDGTPSRRHYRRVVRLQVAQRAVNAFIEEVIERISADPQGESSLPDLRVRLSELRSEVDQAAAELIDGMARRGEHPPAD
jgi:hypothetical protein